MNAPIEQPVIKHTSGLQITTQMIFFGCLEPPVKVSLVFIFLASAECSSPANLARKTGKARKITQKMGVTPLTDTLPQRVCCIHWNIMDTWRPRGEIKAGWTYLGQTYKPFFFQTFWKIHKEHQFRLDLQILPKGNNFEGVKIGPLNFFTNLGTGLFPLLSIIFQFQVDCHF